MTRIAIIGGTGLGDALGGETGQVHEVDTPFGKPSSPITQVTWDGGDVLTLQRHGPGHVLNPSAVPYRANLFALKSLGVTHILASGATGSLREHLHPGELVLVDQVIDKTFRRAGTFYEKAAVHVEFAQPFCPVMRQWLLTAARREGLDVVDDDTGTGDSAGGAVRVHTSGTYVCMEGPQFSTVAESHLHRQWGGDLIGMTCMPEARLAREAEIAYALIAMPTDYDCWRPRPRKLGDGATDSTDPGSLLQEIIGNLQKATAANLALMKAALQDTSALDAQRSPAHDALALGIWSDKKAIDPAQVQRLRPLWGRYFE